jgi:TPR repeat protein
MDLPQAIKNTYNGTRLAESYYIIARHYKNGWIFERNIILALKYYNLAIKFKSIIGAYELAKMYFMGDSVDSDKNRALEYVKQGIEFQVKSAKDLSDANLCKELMRIINMPEKELVYYILEDYLD